MSTLTKEQVLKFAAAWQAMILLITWYVNTFGVDTLNRLLFGVALLIALIILFLKKDNTEKVAVAIGTIDRFLTSQKETAKAKEASENDMFDSLDDSSEFWKGFTNWLLEGMKQETKAEEEPVQSDTEVL